MMGKGDKCWGDSEKQSALKLRWRLAAHCSRDGFQPLDMTCSHGLIGLHLAVVQHAVVLVQMAAVFPGDPHNTAGVELLVESTVNAVWQSD